MLAWRFLRALWRTFLVYYRHSLVRLLNSLLLGISSSLVELCGPLDCLVLAFLFGTSWFPHHLFVLPLEELLGLLKTLAELGFIGVFYLP